MRMALTGWIALGLLAFCASRLCAETEAADETDKLIAKLGDEDYVERTKATEALRKAGYHAAAKIRKARDEAKDPEVKARLSELLAAGFPYPAKEAQSSIAGRVTFKGEAPPRKELDVTSNETCVKILNGEKLLSENLVVGKEGQLANVVVHVSKGLEAFRFDPPKEPAEVSCEKCRFHPHVLPLMAGQGLNLRTVDPMLVNWNAVGYFNFGRMKPGVDLRKFEDPAVVTLKSDAHAWMRAYFVVLDHPFHAVTKEDGTFEIKGLLPGTYTLTFWHEELGTQTQEVTVGEKERTDVNAEFTKK